MPFLLNSFNKQLYLNLWYLNKNYRLFQTSAQLLRKSHYDILGVKINASQGEIKKAYFKMMKKYHPDSNVNKSDENKEKDQKMFLNVQKAYEILADIDLKEEYDKKMFGRISSANKRKQKDIFDSQSNFYGTIKKKPTGPKRSKEERHELVKHALVRDTFRVRRQTHEFYEKVEQQRVKDKESDRIAPFVILFFLCVMFIICLI